MELLLNLRVAVDVQQFFRHRLTRQVNGAWRRHNMLLLLLLLLLLMLLLLLLLLLVLLLLLPWSLYVA